ncbi:hypothetical protein [Streptomyces sp. NPDC046862]|uniref:hypothetical protein n=1 Tax=Streptomyces sp. NPDC046862 TaxID=3154603 RepID=UPI0034529502
MTYVKKLATAFVSCSLLLLSAAPASAQVDGNCGTYICVMTAHHNRFVQDITVRTKDGLPGKLRAYWGNFRSPRVNAASHRWAVNYEQANAKLVCGGLERDGRTIEDGVCVTI